MTPHAIAIKSRFMFRFFPVFGKQIEPARGAAGCQARSLWGEAAAGNRRVIAGAQRIRRAAVMPETSPLRPISHWRVVSAAIELASVLKTQSLR